MGCEGLLVVGRTDENGRGAGVELPVRYELEPFTGVMKRRQGWIGRRMIRKTLLD